MDKSNIKKNYNPPAVQSVSFIVEVGQTASLKVGKPEEELMQGTQQLNEQTDGWTSDNGRYF